MGQNRNAPVPAPALRTSSFRTHWAIDVYNVEAEIGSPVVVTLDAYAVVSDQVQIVDVAGNAGTQPITIEGDRILGHGTSVSINEDNGCLRLLRTFDESGPAWAVMSSASVTNSDTSTVSTPMTAQTMGAGSVTVVAVATMEAPASGNVIATATLSLPGIQAVVGPSGTIGLRYKKHSDVGYTSLVTSPIAGDGTGSVAAFINGLTPGTSYDFAAVIAVAGGSVTSKVATAAGGVTVRAQG